MEFDALAAEKRQKLLQSTELKVMPVIAQKVIQLVNSTTSSVDQLERTLASDPGLTAKILRMANSPYYGLQNEVTTISMAIVVLGFKSLKSLVLTAATKSTYTNPGPIQELLWEHAICAAIACRNAIPLIAKSISPDEAFIVGLLHDVGKVIINNQEPRVYKTVWKKAALRGAHIAGIEFQYFQITHAELGGIVLRHWHMPEDNARAIELQHNGFRGIPDKGEQYRDIISLIHLGDYVCARLRVGYDYEIAEPEPMDFPELRRFGLTDEQLQALTDKTKEDLRAEKKFFT